jgi:hypothetical protein
MKVFEMKMRLIAPVVLLCAFVFFGSQSLQAQQTISFPNFNSPAGLQINGDARVVTNVDGARVLRLTPAASSQDGTAWSATTLSLAQGFSTTFKFQITHPDGDGIGAADGFAFVIQNGAFLNETSGSSAFDRAAAGGGIGFQGLTNSLAIEFDTYCNFENSDTCVSNDFSSDNEVGVLSCGAGANSSNHDSCGIANVSVSSPILADGRVHTAVITYTPPSSDCIESCSGTLAITLDLLPVLTTRLNLASLGLDTNQDAFVGFTAATGAGFENHDILSWWGSTANQNPQTVTLGGPGMTTTVTFNTDTYKITPTNNAGNEQLTVEASLIPASAFPAGLLPSFPNERCIPYGDYSAALGMDTCVEFQVHCQLSATDPTPCNFIYLLATGYDLPTDLSGGIGGPDFLVAHGVSGIANGNCPLTSTSMVQSIFLSYEATIKDPTTRGTSGGPSCFVATYTPGAPIVTGTVSRSQFVGWESPVVDSALNQVKAGSTRPLKFQYFDTLGNPVTNLSLCNSFTGNVCTDPSLPAGTPWVNFTPVGIACPNGTPINSATDTTLSVVSNSGLLNQGGGNYQLNWKTQRLWQGSCANIVVTFDSGLVVTPATIGFQFN